MTERGGGAKESPFMLTICVSPRFSFMIQSEHVRNRKGRELNYVIGNFFFRWLENRLRKNLMKKEEKKARKSSVHTSSVRRDSMMVRENNKRKGVNISH